MFNDNTSLLLCTVTLLLFCFGAATGILANLFYIGFIVIIYLLIIVNILISKKTDSEDVIESIKKSQD